MRSKKEKFIEEIKKGMYRWFMACEVFERTIYGVTTIYCHMYYKGEFVEVWETLNDDVAVYESVLYFDEILNILQHKMDLEIQRIEISYSKERGIIDLER